VAYLVTTTLFVLGEWGFWRMSPWPAESDAARER
jgi:hypothetical protein